MYGIDTHLFKKGDVVIVLTRWPLGSSFTNTMHVVPTLFCAPEPLLQALLHPLLQLILGVSKACTVHLEL